MKKTEFATRTAEWPATMPTVAHDESAANVPPAAATSSECAANSGWSKWYHVSAHEKTSGDIETSSETAKKSGSGGGPPATTSLPVPSSVVRSRGKAANG